MRREHLWTRAVLVVAIGGIAAAAVAQQRAPETVTAQAAGKEVPLPVPGKAVEEEQRFQFVPHQFGVNDVLQEIYIKLDCYTGKTWRFHASTAKWTPIPEPTGGHPLEASEENRYELLTHDYYDTYGEEQELIMRVDGVTGLTWTYRGATGGWKEIEQEN